MRILSWNCRGVGRTPTVRALKALIRSEGPDIVFVVETKSSSPKLEKVKSSMGFASLFCVDAIGKAGGLAIFWKFRVDLEVVYSDRYVIASLIYLNPPNSAWLLITVYGPPYVAQRSKFWNLMEDLVLSFSSQWLLIEDLNSISCRSEKRGGSKKGEGSSRSFINFVDKVGAIDLGFCGS
jgi:hypothetical protein